MIPSHHTFAFYFEILRDPRDSHSWPRTPAGQAAPQVFRRPRMLTPSRAIHCEPALCGSIIASSQPPRPALAPPGRLAGRWAGYNHGLYFYFYYEIIMLRRSNAFILICNGGSPNNHDCSGTATPQGRIYTAKKWGKNSEPSHCSQSAGY